MLGIRYEYNHTPETVGERVEQALDPVELKREAEQAASICNANEPHRCDDLVAAIASAFPADFRVSFDADRNDVDARLGFAWNPFGNSRTVLRGGFATYSGQFPAIVIDQSRNTFPTFLPLNLANFSPRLDARTFLFNLANPNIQQLDSNLVVISQGTLSIQLPCWLIVCSTCRTWQWAQLASAWIWCCLRRSSNTLFVAICPYP